MALVDKWLIVGPRRWGRLMAAELCAALPAEAVVHMQGDPADEELKDWLATSCLETKIQVGLDFPHCPIGSTGVAFVVNSAYLHKTTTEDLLNARYNVVCEKPITFSRRETLGLIKRAEELQLQLFCTNTYLFASYMDTFREKWLTGYRFDSMHICWADPAREVRYGEAKGYDSSVPLIYDVLPHIANIALATRGEFRAISHSLQVGRGGSSVSVHYRCEDFDIHAALERNATQRKRTITFSSVARQILYDFSSEPGFVSVDRLPPVPVDLPLTNKPKPIAAMIRSVREFFESGKPDPRLSISACLFGNDLIDAVSDSYATEQASLLPGYIDMPTALSSSADLDYANKEAKSIATRALPYLAEESPLRKLAFLASPISRPT
jgi:hypothetical protein